MITINKLVANSIVITTVPIVKPETHIKFYDGTEDDYLIEGTMDCPALIAAGLMPEGSGKTQEPSWIKQPLEATIGSAVTSIGSYVFYKCGGLTSVTIPDSVKSIGSSAFDGCMALTSVHITDIAKWCNIRFAGSNQNPLYYAHNLYLNGAHVTDLTIPSGVTSISDFAFSYCRGLTSVMIQDDVTSIGSDAFYGCSGLTSVTIGNSVTNIGAYAFCECDGLTSVTIPASVTSIGNYAFRDCSGLMSVTFSGKDKATVQGMNNHYWSLPSGCVIHCTDGDITL